MARNRFQWLPSGSAAVRQVNVYGCRINQVKCINVEGTSIGLFPSHIVVLAKPPGEFIGQIAQRLGVSNAPGGRRNRQHRPPIGPAIDCNFKTLLGCVRMLGQILRDHRGSSAAFFDTLRCGKGLGNGGGCGDFERTLPPVLWGSEGRGSKAPAVKGGGLDGAGAGRGLECCGLEALISAGGLASASFAGPSEACGCPNRKTSSVVAARPRSLLLFFTMHLYRSRKTILLRTENAGHICIVLPYATGSHIRRFSVKIYTTPAAKLSSAGQLANGASSGNPLPVRQGFCQDT